MDIGLMMYANSREGGPAQCTPSLLPVPAGAAPEARLRRLRPLLAGMLALGLSGCDWVLFDSKGAVGIAQRDLIFICIALMVIVVIPAIVLAFVFPWRFFDRWGKLRLYAEYGTPAHALFSDVQRLMLEPEAREIAKATREAAARGMLVAEQAAPDRVVAGGAAK